MIYLYGSDTQTCKLSHSANLLNYALSSVGKGDIILGFKVVEGNLADYMSHVKLDGKHFTLCTAREDTVVRRWDSEEDKLAEQTLIDNGYVWLVDLGGYDDHNGYTRFKTLEDAKKWFVGDDVINYSNDKYWMVN